MSIPHSLWRSTIYAAVDGDYDNDDGGASYLIHYKTINWNKILEMGTRCGKFLLKCNELVWFSILHASARFDILKINFKISWKIKLIENFSFFLLKSFNSSNFYLFFLFWYFFEEFSMTTFIANLLTNRLIFIEFFFSSLH